jgi:hypothetical protein
MSLQGRVRRLETRLRQRWAKGLDCPNCAHPPGSAVVLDDDEVAQGPGATERVRPCPRCGRLPERIIRIVETIVPARSD